jgi:hypothetical protein
MKDTKNSTWKQKMNSSQSLKGTIKFIFRHAKEDYNTHAQILEKLKARVYDVAKFKTLPMYMRAEISGYIEANYDIMYTLLEFAHWYDGEFVGKKLPYGKDFKQHLINESSHVYKGTQNRY